MKQKTPTSALLDQSKIELQETFLENQNSALRFASIGVGCFALTFIDRIGLLSSLLIKGFICDSDVEKFEQFKKTASRSALVSLESCGVLTRIDNRYKLTSLGNNLVKYIGLFTMVFEGYGELMAKGVQIGLGKVKQPEKFINEASVAKSSVQFGESAVDLEVETLIKSLNIKGTICDLGCGSADRLLKLCKATNLPGLGLDSSAAAVRIARKTTKSYPLIEIEQEDGANLQGVWEDVQVLMQCFMIHDICPDQKLVECLISYKRNFPNLEYIVIVDIVAPDDPVSTFMPAFDYVHGLLGIDTRRYDRFVSLFERSGYDLAKEVSLNMPNTYLWVLKKKI